jgi:uncharacterized protein
MTSDNPNDMDVAVFQDSSEGYIRLAMKYRKFTRGVSRKISVDIFPIRSGAVDSVIFPEIEDGEVVYER